MCVIALSLLATSKSYSQFKRTADDEPKVSDSFISPETDSDLLSFFNPDNFKMRQSFSMELYDDGRARVVVGDVYEQHDV